MQLARILGAVGRTCIAAGVLILLFVAYQLWGTGIQEARAQSNLEDQFDAALEEAGVPGAVSGTGTSTPEGPSSAPVTAPPPPPEGDAVARIRIPEIGVDKIVVEGVSVADLKRGPGHYPDSPLPGQPGNAAIAGHRTTYGAPFHRIDELDPGDEILVTTLQGTFRYEVSDTQIVRPDQVEVLDDFGDNRLTLTACNPKYSARQRIVVVAHLAPDVQPAPPSTAAPGSDAGSGSGPDSGSDDSSTVGEDDEAGLIGGLSGERAAVWPAFLMALACALIWLIAWLVAQQVPRPWLAYVVGAPFFLVALFFFFENFSRLLPANF
ncbi:MAG TPA: class E sortase [Acidimicrobiales bacterium]